MEANTHLIRLHDKALAKKRYWIMQKRCSYFPNPMAEWMVLKWTRVEASLRDSVAIHADTLISTEQLYRDLAWQTH